MAVTHMDDNNRHKIETPVWTEEMIAQRRARSRAMAWAIAGFMVLIFAVTLVKLGDNILNRPL